MVVTQARFELPKSPFIGGRLNPKYRHWWISIFMTLLIAIPMALIMAIIVYGTENLGYNFLLNLAAAGPVAFFAAHFGYNGLKIGRFTIIPGIGPFAQKVMKYDFPMAMRTQPMRKMLSSGKFWGFGLIVDSLLCVEIAVLVSFIKVPWLAMKFAPGWFGKWMIALAQSYALAFGIALVGIIGTIWLLKIWMWKPTDAPPTTKGN
ncbi:MAG: hypothetical protein ACTSQF_04350 [Candidatus Heimdallarchaeaceae archaeon]